MSVTRLNSSRVIRDLCLLIADLSSQILDDPFEFGLLDGELFAFFQNFFYL